MSWRLRIPAELIGRVRADLERPHPFAAERVGFVLARRGTLAGPETLLLAAAYQSIQDEHYVRDRMVGAKIGSGAIRGAMQRALTEGCSVLHVHMHEHLGRPGFSTVDLRDLPPFVAALRNVAPDHPHGALLLSRDECQALVWLPGEQRPAAGGRITIVGRPMLLFDSGEDLYG